jgi:hypothetical protein
MAGIKQGLDQSGISHWGKLFAFRAARINKAGKGDSSCSQSSL